jgi:uncharacterized protein (TIGR03067 family)
VNSVLLLVAALTVSAPALKEKPKAAADEPTGEWEIQGITVSGRQTVFNGQVIYSFTKDGKWAVSRDGKATGIELRVEFDAKAAPPTIDLISNPQAATSRQQGIYKIDGDTLTICVRRGKAERPTAFESPEGSGVTLYVMKRVQKESRP